ncbi:MAG: N-acetylneuraminate synthase [Bacteroidetes bacterium]|nr:N-acetylneuraminate synthase [Bacteroidota bacterium]
MSRVLLIAEAGVNHNGDYEMAKQLAVVAKEAGADIVKYQTAIPELVMSSSAPKAEYQKVQTGSGESQLEMARKIHLPLEAYAGLKKYCEEEVGIQFLSTPFDHPSIDLLHNIGMEIFKIPSGEITNRPYLEKVGALEKEVILSTGMSTLEEVKRAFNTLVDSGTPAHRISVLHCTSDYPAPFEHLNLRAIETLQRELNCRVGYSDHSVGLEASIAAVALGATIVEKHFTLSHNLEGPDHKASLEPEELKQWVTSIRHTEQALGDGIKVPKGSEILNIPIGRRSVHAARDLYVGQFLTKTDLIMKRPGNGISPYDLDKIIGKKLIAAVKADEQISWDILE